MQRTLIRATILAAFVAAGPLLAGTQSIDRTVEARPNGEVQLEIWAGKLTVKAWDRNAVRVTGTIEDAEEFEMDADDGGVEISVSPRDGEHNFRSHATALEVFVPAGSSVGVETISSDTRITGVRGTVTFESVSGSLEIDDALAELDVETVSGSTRVRATGRLREASFESVSGKVEWIGALHPSGHYTFESVSGTLVLRLPARTSAEFRVQTFSGSITNELGPAAEKTSPYIPSLSLEFSIGGGGARVRAESFSGRVSILRE